jgi:hypothetical protein
MPRGRKWFPQKPHGEAFPLYLATLLSRDVSSATRLCLLGNWFYSSLKQLSFNTPKPHHYPSKVSKARLLFATQAISYLLVFLTRCFPTRLWFIILFIFRQQRDRQWACWPQLSPWGIWRGCWGLRSWKSPRQGGRVLRVAVGCMPMWRAVLSSAGLALTALTIVLCVASWATLLLW